MKDTDTVQKGNVVRDAGGSGHSDRVCPACKSVVVRRSQMRGVVERSLLKPLGVKAYRCEKCDERFYGFGRHGSVSLGAQDKVPKSVHGVVPK